MAILQQKIIHQILTAIQKSLINPDNLLVEVCPQSIRQGLVAPTPAGARDLHLDNSLNSEASGVLVLAKRLKILVWRSLKWLSPKE